MVKSLFAFNELRFTQNVGLKNIPDTVETPGDVFLMLLSTENIELIVHQTSLQNKNKNDVLVTAEEMKKFIGVNINIEPVQFLSNFHDPSALSEVERRQNMVH